MPLNDNTSAPQPSPFNPQPTNDDKIKSMEFHRQVLASRMDEKQTQYISPSDTIMSPCTAKLSAMKNKHFLKAKPQSLFAQTAQKNHQSSGLHDCEDLQPVEKEKEKENDTVA